MIGSIRQLFTMISVIVYEVKRVTGLLIRNLIERNVYTS